jgi:hypothetical protein
VPRSGRPAPRSPALTRSKAAVAPRISAKRRLARENAGQAPLPPVQVLVLPRALLLRLGHRPAGPEVKRRHPAKRRPRPWRCRGCCRRGPLQGEAAPERALLGEGDAPPCGRAEAGAKTRVQPISARSSFRYQRRNPRRARPTTLHGQQATLPSADPARAPGTAHLGREASRGGAQARTRAPAHASQDPAAASGPAAGSRYASRPNPAAVVARRTGVFLPPHRHLSRQQGRLPDHPVLHPERSHSSARGGGPSHRSHPWDPGAGHPLRACLQPRRRPARVGLVRPLPQPRRHQPARDARRLRLCAPESFQTLR